MKFNFSILLICLISLSSLAQTFQDNVANETMGDFPSQWDIVGGMATVDQQDGYKYISFRSGGIIKPIVNDQTNNYLGEDFTVEFDVFFDQTSSLYGQGFQLRLWDGAYGYDKDGIRYKPFMIYRDGLETDWNHPEPGNAKNHLKEFQTLDPVWRHVKIECKTGRLKIRLDDKLVLNFPRFKMQPTMVSIGGSVNDSQFDAKIGFTNFTITGLRSMNTSSTTSNDSHTESEIIATNPYNPSPTDTNQESNTSTSNTNTASNNTSQTGTISSTINTPNGVTQDTTLDENVGFGPVDTTTVTPLDSIAIQQPYDPIDTTTNPQILTPGLVEKPIKLKVTLTDLLCIKKYESEARYNFRQAISYTTGNNNKVAIEKIKGNMDNETTIEGYSVNTLGAKSYYFIVDEASGKKISNVMNALIFEITTEEASDKSSKFIIKSFLEDNSYNFWGNSKGVLYDSFIEVDIYDLLIDLQLLKQGENVEGFNVPFHDPDIMKAQYGLFKTYDGGPNAKLWVRQVGETLEGPISLGNTTQNDGHRGAAWIKFELLEY
ncbi:hypothetical protein E1J38_011690 [Seonamhaeicola sediminis]|uniref:DUF1080 domain-containing protein n=1 Tax=Seonamhaeicola sediminis TaxID=2528206 RepID=A0A562YD46_9FLAO|nr:hypothetical protein [Seonamhaeicola sediminis]TWO32031.1 hypothetical protein E1J38_011690 [Seonamhaeicola sediminis]